MLRKIEDRRGRGQQRMKFVGWRHRFNGHELGQTLGDGERRGSLAYCSPWGSRRVGCDLATEQQHTHTWWGRAS